MLTTPWAARQFIGIQLASYFGSACEFACCTCRPTPDPPLLEGLLPRPAAMNVCSCAVSPLSASCGRTRGHGLNRGGNRAAENAFGQGLCDRGQPQAGDDPTSYKERQESWSNSVSDSTASEHPGGEGGQSDAIRETERTARDTDLGREAIVERTPHE